MRNRLLAHAHARTHALALDDTLAREQAQSTTDLQKKLRLQVTEYRVTIERLEVECSELRRELAQAQAAVERQQADSVPRAEFEECAWQFFCLFFFFLARSRG